MIYTDIPLIQSKSRELSTRVDRAKLKLTIIDLFINATPNVNSRRALMADIKLLEAYLRSNYDIGLLEASLAHLGDYREYLAKSGSSIATIKRKVASIRRLYKFLHVEGTLEANIAQNLEGPKLYRVTGATPVFGKIDLSNVLNSFDIFHPVECRNKLAIAMMYYTACRVGALVQLRIEDLQRVASHYEIRLKEKRGVIHTVVSHPSLTELIDHFIQLTGITTGHIFLQSRKGWRKFYDKPLGQRSLLNMIKKTCKVLDIDTIYGNHSLRASAITNHLGNGGKLQEAKKLACHRSADMTSMYNRDDKVIKLEEVLRMTL